MDALGRLTKVTDAESNVTETRYYPDSKVWAVNHAHKDAIILVEQSPRVLRSDELSG